jgi:hypothetical protein
MRQGSWEKSSLGTGQTHCWNGTLWSNLPASSPAFICCALRKAFLMRLKSSPSSRPSSTALGEQRRRQSFALCVTMLPPPAYLLRRAQDGQVRHGSARALGVRSGVQDGFASCL